MVLAQLLLLGIFVFDQRVPVLLVAAFVSTVFLLDRPLWAVGMLIAARLVSTGTTSFFSVGGVQIGLFEPVLLFSLVALALRAAFERRSLWVDFPWKPAYFAFVLWNVAGLAWCTKFSAGVKDIVGLFVIFATSTVMLCFVRTWAQVRAMLWWWIGSCVFIGMLAIFGDMIGLTDYSGQWKAAPRAVARPGSGSSRTGSP